MLIAAKFPSVCPRCNEPIAIGEQVSWERGMRAVHAGCSSEGIAAAKTIEASRAKEVDPDLILAAPKGRDYFPFQKAGIAYMLAHPGVIQGDEMGLGKTIQAIGVINNDPEIRSVLVVCPKSLQLNWIRELRTWLCRDLTFGTVIGVTDIVVLTIDEAKKRLDKLLLNPIDCLVLDEAQAYKNSKSQRGKMAQALAKNSNRKLVLTGTPIPNRVIELYPLLQIVAKESFPSGFKFAMRYCDAKHNGFAWDFKGSSNLDELQIKLRSTCMIRRKKLDVLSELPTKQRQVIEIPSGISASVLAERQAWEAIEGRLGALRAAVELAKTSENRQDLTDAVANLNQATVVGFAEISSQRHATALEKIPAVIDHVTSLLEADDESKIIVFAHHKDVIEKLRASFDKFGCVRIVGDDSSEARDAAVQRFQTDPKTRVFVGSITAAGTGITLTASSTVVFAELSYVPGEMLQAEDRAHRIGQRNSVLVQMLVLEGSLDARMAQILVDKMAVADLGLDEPVAIPTHEPSADTPSTSEQLAEVAMTIKSDTMQKVHSALRQLAGLCDGASTRDGFGFSKIDTYIGHSLANMRELTPKQAALGLKLCKKYRRQLGDGVWSEAEA